MRLLATRLPFLETVFLRRGAGALAARRECCRDCGRTPLVGEYVYVFGTRLVCELCRTLRRDSPTEHRLVHSPEHDRAVRVRRAV